MITRDEMLKKYHISLAEFMEAEITWEDLTDIYWDFLKIKEKKYKEILSHFQDEFLSDVSDKGIHSYRTRIKDAEHLIVKIIRKRLENHLKYKDLDKYNYEKFLTDLIGIRCFILFKADWEKFHKYITSQIEDNPLYYVADSLKDFDDEVNHCYIAEKPKVHIRSGDARNLYEKMLAPDAIKSQKIYRSVHYIIKYCGVYIEIQVRTLFEEGWGEIDHNIVYPYYQGDVIFQQYTGLINRLAGLADEMGSFFCELKRLELEHIENSLKTAEGMHKERVKESITPDEQKPWIRKSGNTPADCLDDVVRE